MSRPPPIASRVDGRGLMEWAVLLGFALLAAALVALPIGGADRVVAEDEAALLATERARLLAELRELDADASAGRISPGDRAEGRRALAPRLRAVTEALRSLGRREGGE